MFFFSLFRRPLIFFFFFFNDTATTEIYTLSLHDALPISETAKAVSTRQDYSVRAPKLGADELGTLTDSFNQMLGVIDRKSTRLNSSHSQISYAVFCLKKKKQKHYSLKHNISHIHHTLIH